MTDITRRGELLPGPEVRTYPAKFEIRTMANGNVKLTGYASTTEQPYDMYDMFGEYTEVIRAGAFGKTLAEGADVSFLVNHGGLTMARTKAKTLSLAEDATGLLIDAELNPKRSDVRDLTTSIEDQNTDEMSFAFLIERQAWSPDWSERSILEVNMNRGDVSAVNYGANPNTSIGVQRAFRTAKPAQLHRMAVELRAGGTVPAATMATLAHILDLIAAADDGLDKAQPLLANILGVPNPDADGEPDADEAARAAGYARALQLRHQADLVALGLPT